MESPVVLDKPPEYHDRGFPFDEEDGAGGWSELAARHPDIAARLRQRPATWARKRRPSSQDATDDFSDNFGGFDRFPFDDIPPEFREHLPSHWNRRFSSREEPPTPPTQQQSPPPQTHQQPRRQTAATQTEHEPETQPEAPRHEQHATLPQYGLRNTVDLGVKSPAEPSVVDAERSQRCMSAPPAHRPQSQPAMSAHNHPEPAPAPASDQHHQQQANVRHIPIFVEGRDEPVINKNVDHGTHFGDTKPHPPQPQPHPQPHPHPHVDRDQYFADDGPVNFHHPANFSRAFGTPFNKGFRQGPQPFTQQKAYPQSAFARGASPQRSHSPKQPPHEEHFVKVPVQHEHAPPRPEPQPRPQQKPAQAPPAPHQPSPQREPTPPQQPKQQMPNDPITQILSIQTDVLNLMTEVENFAGTKKDKRYMFLDEMLTRNLIKLDNIETEGKENIRLARKEAIRCIQKCIAVLEAKAESNANLPAGQPAAAPAPAQDVDMNSQPAETTTTENGEVEMKEANPEPQTESQTQEQTQPPPNDDKLDTQNPEQSQPNETTPAPVDNMEAQPAAHPDTTEQVTENKPDQQKDVKVENKSSKKKVGKKNRDKSASKDSKDKAETAKDSNKTEQETMQVDDKGDKAEPQVMEVDAGASQ